MFVKPIPFPTRLLFLFSFFQRAIKQVPKNWKIAETEEMFFSCCCFVFPENILNFKLIGKMLRNLPSQYPGVFLVVVYVSTGRSCSQTRLHCWSASWHYSQSLPGEQSSVIIITILTLVLLFALQVNWVQILTLNSALFSPGVQRLDRQRCSQRPPWPATCPPAPRFLVG